MDIPLKNGPLTVVPLHSEPLAMDDRGDFGFGQHLLIWSWRRMAAGRSFCPLMMDDFAAAFGDDGPEVFATFCTFLQALGFASRRPLIIGAPGCPAITADERQALTLLAAAQADAPAMLQAHLRWIALPEKRTLLKIATSALARALAVNDMHLDLPAHILPTQCERPRAVTERSGAYA
jgi:hypothetical protein